MLLSAVKYLKNPDSVQGMPVAVLFGDDAYMRAEVYREIRSRILDDEDAEFSLVEYEGNSVRFIDVMREVATPPMFGGAVRLVRVTEADSFVSEYSEKLVEYLKAPSSAGVLLLQVKVLMSVSKFYKAVEQKGLLIDVKSPDFSELNEWLEMRLKVHQLKAGRGALSLMIELIGSEPGLLDSELLRLSTVAPDRVLTESFVADNVGSWKLRKVWDMLDDALNGNLPKALHQLDLLIAAGEQPIGILAQMAANLRKFAAATLIYLDAERSGKRITPEAAVSGAGFYKTRTAAEQMKKLGRRRGLKMSNRLLKADLDLKGGSRIDPRTIIEELLAELSSSAMR